MKGSVLLSVALDVLAVGIILVPDSKFTRFTADPKWIRKGKYVCAGALLVSGFLIDHFISHAG